MSTSPTEPLTSEVAETFPVVLRTSRSHRWSVLVVLLLLVCCLVGLPLLLQTAGRDVWAAVAMETAMLAFAVWGMVEVRHFRDAVHIDEDRITYVGPRGRRRALRWDEITRVQVDSMTLTFRLYNGGNDDAAMKIHITNFERAMYLGHVLYHAWWKTREGFFSKLVLPRVFRDRLVRPCLLGCTFLIVCLAGGIDTMVRGRLLDGALVIAGAPILGAAFVLAMPIELTVGTDELRIRHLVGLTRRVRYADIADVTRAAACIAIKRKNGKRFGIGMFGAESIFEILVTMRVAWLNYRGELPSEWWREGASPVVAPYDGPEKS